MALLPIRRTPPTTLNSYNGAHSHRHHSIVYTRPHRHNYNYQCEFDANAIVAVHSDTHEQLRACAVYDGV